MSKKKGETKLRAARREKNHFPPGFLMAGHKKKAPLSDPRSRSAPQFTGHEVEQIGIMAEWFHSSGEQEGLDPAAIDSIMEKTATTPVHGRAALTKAMQLLALIKTAAQEQADHCGEPNSAPADLVKQIARLGELLRLAHAPETTASQPLAVKADADAWTAFVAYVGTSKTDSREGSILGVFPTLAAAQRSVRNFNDPLLDEWQNETYVRFHIRDAFGAWGWEDEP